MKRLTAWLLAAMLLLVMATPASAGPTCNTGRANDGVVYGTGSYVTAGAGNYLTAIEGSLELQRPYVAPGTITYQFIELREAAGSGVARIGVQWVNSQSYATAWRNVTDASGNVLIGGPIPSMTFADNTSIQLWMVGFMSADDFDWGWGAAPDEGVNNTGWLSTRAAVWARTATASSQVPGETASDMAWFSSLSYARNGAYQGWKSTATGQNPLGSTQAGVANTDSASATYDKKCLV